MKHCEMDFIEVNVKQVFNLDSLNVETKILGEGSYGCVLKSVDGKYAIKVQEITVRDKCQYESSLQHKLSEVVLDAAVSQVYYYDANITQIPALWRNALSQGCKKGPVWEQKNWSGLFCITVMDFLPGSPPTKLHFHNLPLFCFSLLYTVSVGYEKMKFQHLDIKTDNIIMVPYANKSMVYYTCDISSSFTFTHATHIPKMVDFGISTSIDVPRSINVLENRGGTIMITPFEVAAGRIISRNPNIRTFMHSDGPTRYHWSYDLFSIGITILNATLSTNEHDIIGFRMIQDTLPYMSSFLQRYGINPQSPEAQQPGMVLMFMYNLCILQELLGNGRYPDQNDTALSVFYPQNSVGYDLLFTPDSKKVIDYIVAKNISLYANDIERLKQTYGATSVALVASLLRWNPEKRGGGKGQILKDPYFAPFRSQMDCGPQRPKPQPQPKPQQQQEQGKTFNTFILVVGDNRGQRLAYLKKDTRTKQYSLFAGCNDLKSSLEGGCTTEDLKSRPTIELRTDTERNRFVLMDIQNRRMKMLEAEQLYTIDLPTLLQIAIATKSGHVAAKGSITIATQVLSAVRYFKKTKIL